MGRVSAVVQLAVKGGYYRGPLPALSPSDYLVP